MVFLGCGIDADLVLKFHIAVRDYLAGFKYQH